MTKTSYKERHLKSYINHKKKMLDRDFFITLTADESNHFDTLKTEAQIDAYTRELLRKYL